MAITNFTAGIYDESVQGDLDTSGNNLQFGTDTTIKGTTDTTDADDIVLDELSLGFLEVQSNPRAPAAGTRVACSVTGDNPHFTIVVTDFLHVAGDQVHAFAVLDGSGATLFV